MQLVSRPMDVHGAYQGPSGASGALHAFWCTKSRLLRTHWHSIGTALACAGLVMLQSYLVTIVNVSDSFRLFQTLSDSFRLSDVHRVWQFGTETLVFGTGQHLTGCLSAQDLKGVLVKRGTQLCENTCFFLVRCWFHLYLCLECLEAFPTCISCILKAWSSLSSLKFLKAWSSLCKEWHGGCGCRTSLPCIGSEKRWSDHLDRAKPLTAMYPTGPWSNMWARIYI